ncbi:hypothetical protein R1sor_024291 [Riccia sorocarpa]|uniref:Uncharacterized protein n=1 Tax=Riccia sorocarpa TaxID=122646 RepID=A0ABD3GTB7_9MARC
MSNVFRAIHWTYAHSNQDSQGSIKRWHTTLKQYLRGSRKEKSARQIKCLLLLGSFTEVQLLHRLGTRWDSISGGVQNLYAGNQPIDAEVQEVEIPVETFSSDNEDDDDCVIIPLKQTLNVKASRELQDATTDDDQHPQPFVPIPGNDSSLKRKKNFLEKFYSKRRRPEARNFENVSTEIDDDNRFQTLPTSTMSMQEALDKTTHESLDLNASFYDNKDEMKPIPCAPTKCKRHNQAVNISMKQQVGAGKQPMNVIFID